MATFLKGDEVKLVREKNDREGWVTAQPVSGRAHFTTLPEGAKVKVVSVDPQYPGDDYAMVKVRFSGKMYYVTDKQLAKV